MTAADDRFVDADGIRMRARSWSASRMETAVLVLHGFTGSIESIEEACVALADSRPVVALDLVGHGETECPEDPARYSMDACVAQVAGAMSQLGILRAHLVGYSMGARVALSLAVAERDRVASLALVGVSPGLAESRDREKRVGGDALLAQRIEREGLEAFIDFWMALPLFASQASRGKAFLAQSRAQRLRSNPRGLAASLRGMGTGAMPPLHDRLAEVALPVRLFAGEKDLKFTALSEDVAAALPHAERVLIPGVGHAAHLENPEAFARIARDFFEQCDARPETSSP